jgi:hypothetical protein
VPWDMKMNKWIKRFIIITWIPSIIIIAGWIILNNLPEPKKGIPTEEEVMISERLGVKPDWEAIRIYYEESIHTGMTREEAIAIIDKIGPWESTYYLKYHEINYNFSIIDEEKFIEVIEFIDEDTASKLGTWVVSYEYGKVS